MKSAGLFSLLLAATSVLLGTEEPAKTPAPAPVEVKTVAEKPAGNPAATSAPAEVKPADAKPAAVSPELAQQMTSVMPKYSPAPPEPAKPATLDPDVIELPKVTVTHKTRPRIKLTEEVMMTKEGFNEKLAKENLSSFDRNFLNKFTLPSWTGAMSAEERAREEYRLKKNAETKQEALDLANVAAVLDPAQAKTIRDAVSKP